MQAGELHGLPHPMNALRGLAAANAELKAELKAELQAQEARGRKVRTLLPEGGATR